MWKLFSGITKKIQQLMIGVLGLWPMHHVLIVVAVIAVTLAITLPLNFQVADSLGLIDSVYSNDSSNGDVIVPDTLRDTASALQAAIISITSDAVGATVYIDGVLVGLTPFMTNNILPGTHQITLSNMGFSALQRSVFVMPGEDVLVHIPFSKDPSDLSTADNLQSDSLPIESAVDRIINGLKEAKLAFNTPDSMTVGETVPLVLLMSFDLPRGDLRVALAAQIEYAPHAGPVRDTAIRMSEMAEAHLTGHGFTIKPVSEIAQWVKSAGSTSWEWSVKADTPGTHMLYLTINAFIDYNGKTTTQTIETFRREIVVHVEPMAVLWGWFWRLANVIYGLLLIVVGFLINHFLTRWVDKGGKKKQVQRVTRVAKAGNYSSSSPGRKSVAGPSDPPLVPRKHFRRRVGARTPPDNAP